MAHGRTALALLAAITLVSEIGDNGLASRAAVRILPSGPTSTLVAASKPAAPGGIYKVGNGHVRVAGGGSSNPPDNVPATSAQLSSPNQLTVGPDGSIYFVDKGIYRVCKITPDGVIHSIGGTGLRGGRPETDGGLATQSAFRSPISIALGPDGSVYVGDDYTDDNYATVRRIAPNGIITRYARNFGTGTPGDDAPGKAIDKWLTAAVGLCVDAAGNLYIAEPGQTRVRKVGVLPDPEATDYGRIPRSTEDPACGRAGSRMSRSWPSCARANARA